MHDAASFRVEVWRPTLTCWRCREQGDPKALLKCINPAEAALVDAAAGVHVRFRLGGTTFPPLVFYKVYTHRPVTGGCGGGGGGGGGVAQQLPAGCSCGLGLSSLSQWCTMRRSIGMACAPCTCLLQTSVRSVPETMPANLQPRRRRGACSPGPAAAAPPAAAAAAAVQTQMTPALSCLQS
jgi:hypothetical protein